MKQEKSCGAVVYRQEKDGIEFLLIRSQRDGHWGFPKGHVEAREEEHETATREIAEETGLSVSFLPGFRREIAYPIGQDVTKVAVYFVAEAEKGILSLQREEIEDSCWLPHRQAEEQLTFDNEKNILRAAADFLQRAN